ncbi:SMI1/KNR4 family protein [Mesorhizobium sp. ES1-4]|uniref:SMI1/KNR4 family protein n=1 Tax=Mesorhizobium sp. ES1-4 TaxID=2876627 RepID=UPI001CCFAE4B|nr:SMI1/KNR4 family protein [Mesorhizobium sp. ES1-4]MBZ9794587.1 SMI1/KNR4 family protein [Mesorhizobium sp. ES1-4]
MEFLNPDQLLTDAMIDQCEEACRLVFPAPVREFYLKANGGEPEFYVFQNDELDTAVSEFLPLVSRSRGTAVQSYRRLVTEKALVPVNLFPFAVDGGGDYFFVDTSTAEGAVYFYRSDTVRDEKLVPLNLNFAAFWATPIAERPS